MKRKCLFLFVSRIGKKDQILLAKQQELMIIFLRRKKIIWRITIIRLNWLFIKGLAWS